MMMTSITRAQSSELMESTIMTILGEGPKDDSKLIGALKAM